MTRSSVPVIWLLMMRASSNSRTTSCSLGGMRESVVRKNRSWSYERIVVVNFTASPYSGNDLADTAAKADCQVLVRGERTERILQGRQISREARGKLAGLDSIRVNNQWRLVFRWDGTCEAEGVNFDDYSYR